MTEEIIINEKSLQAVLKRCDELEQENKELKEKLDKEEYNACCECTNIQNQNDKYRSALEEINILAKNYCNACDEFKAKTYKNKNDCLYCNYGFIKNKIKEVLQCE